MRYLTTTICLVLSVLITGSAWAADDATNEGQGDRRAEMRKKILEEFDADGDGEMSEDERATAREEMRKRRGARGQGDGPKGDRPKGKKAKGDRGPRREGQGRRDGHDGPPDPEKMFDKFDADGNGMLSRAEFMKLAEEVRAHRPPHGHGDRGPGDRGGARPDGPPREGKRRFDRERSLQNPGDHPGPPPRPESRRRLNDDEGSATRERGPRGQRGPGARGHEGHGPPNPDAVFDRFDENGDDQLSRAEFMKLADRMREMHERMGDRGGGHGGMREGRGQRPGPPRGGEDGPPRRPRRPRPESDAAAEVPATNDDSI